MSIYKETWKKYLTGDKPILVKELDTSSYYSEPFRLDVWDKVDNNGQRYSIFEGRLAGLPKRVREEGLLYYVPSISGEGKVYGYNSMTQVSFPFNFTRGSSGTYFESYDFKTVSNNFSRSQYTTIGDPGITFLSNTTTNLLKYSNFDSMSVYSTVNDGVSSTSGLNEVALVVSGADRYLYNTSYNTVVGKTYTLSVLIWNTQNVDIKVGTSKTDSTALFCFVLNGAIATDLSTLKLEYINGDYANIPAYESEYVKASITWTATSTNANNGVAKYVGNLGSGFRIFGMQLEEGTVARDFVVTQGSSVIQPAEQLSLDFNALGMDEWTIYMDFSIQTTGDGQPCYILSTDSTAAHSYLYIPDTSTMEVATKYGFNGSNMVIGPIPQNTRQRITLSYSKSKGNGGYAQLRREGKDSPDSHEWSTGTNTPKQIPYSNHLEFFTGPGFASAKLHAFVIFDKFTTLLEDDLNDI